jgi:hypothetical protein
MDRPSAFGATHAAAHLDRRAQGSATKRANRTDGDQQRQPRKLLEMNETGRVV